MKFEGEKEAVNEVQTKFIEDVIKKHGFGDCTVTIEAVGQKGDNYCASVKRIIAEDKDGKKFQMIAKIFLNIEAMRQVLRIYFSNETAMYTDFLPKLTEIQQIAGIPKEEQFMYPACYGIISEAPNELILLEDLKETNFVMRNRMVSLTNYEVKEVLYKLGKFHSLSFVLKQREPKFLEELQKKITSVWSLWEQIPQLKGMFQQLILMVLNLLDEEERAIAQVKLGDFTKTAADLQKSDGDHVIVQGDCWTNNIMLKLGSQKPIECIIIDYQQSHYSAAVKDLFHFIFSSTDYETRSKHFHDWIDYYYKSLEESFNRFSLDSNMVYPRKRFDVDLKKYGVVGFGLSMVITGSLMRESDEVVDMDRFEGNTAEEKLASMMQQMATMGMGQLKASSLLRMKNRVVGLWKSFNEYGYL